jgi:hypothetical protein
LLGEWKLLDSTRGAIESALDKIFGEEIVSYVQWVKGEVPLKSMRDVALGYVIGTAMGLAVGFIVVAEQRPIVDEDRTDIDTIIRRRLPEIIKKVEIELNK